MWRIIAIDVAGRSMVGLPKVESLLETFGTSPGDVGDVRGPWRRWRRSATFVGDVPDLATFGDVRWRPSERTSPASALKESSGEMCGHWQACQEGSPQHERLLETFVRTSPAKSWRRSGPNERLLTTSGDQCLQSPSHYWSGAGLWSSLHGVRLVALHS